MTEHYDVVVLGGGPAGWPAAAQAARLGARTLLVEKNGALGGTTVVGGVALPGLFHAWGRQVIAGIGWEAVRRSTEIAGIPLPDFTAWHLPHYKLQVPVSPGILAAVIDDVVTGSGVELTLHTMLATVERVGDVWRIALCAKEGIVDVTADQVVDCTGDADVVGHLGLPREANAERQPGTLMVRLGGYDPRTLDYDTLEKAYTDALAGGRLLPEDMLEGAHAIRSFLAARGENHIHIVGATSGTSAQRTDAELAARRALLRIFTFLRGQDGLHGLTVERWATECGIRESFTIRGHTRITSEDYAGGRLWPDAVSYSFYPIDVHNPKGLGINIQPLPYGTVPTIPRSAMVPLGSTHLIVAGRSICGDQEANSAYRVQASCMAMGQAAGVNAALAARNRCDILDVDIAAVRQTLREHGAIVPEDAAALGKESSAPRG